MYHIFKKKGKSKKYYFLREKVICNNFLIK